LAPGSCASIKRSWLSPLMTSIRRLARHGAAGARRARARDSERASGRDIFAAFRQDIATPLGMQDFDVSNHTRKLKEDGSLHPAYLFWMSARDLATFGWLYANGGRWAGKPVVSEAWVKASTAVHVPRARAQNAYGYLWWVNTGPDNTQHLFWAAGAGGQFVLVVPASRLVIVHLVGIELLTEAIDEGRTVSWGDFFALARSIVAAQPPASSPSSLSSRSCPSSPRRPWPSPLPARRPRHGPPSAPSPGASGR
jgi:CubicO group peptidase (beta-lactamase class C family)